MNCQTVVNSFTALHGTYSYAGYLFSGKVQRNGSGVGTPHSRKNTSTRLPSELFTWQLSHLLLLVTAVKETTDVTYNFIIFHFVIHNISLSHLFRYPQATVRQIKVAGVVLACSVFFELFPPAPPHVGTFWLVLSLFRTRCEIWRPNLSRRPQCPSYARPTYNRNSNRYATVQWQGNLWSWARWSHRILHKTLIGIS